MLGVLGLKILLIEDEAAAQRTLALRIRSIEHNNASATSRASR
jgi:hypothetical protein